MISRKLASVQVVAEVAPILGADAIEKVRVLGWWVVTRKGEYRPGEKVVYCEIDALLPEKPEFEFLRKSSSHASGGFRIKTVRLRGQVSQGICFDLSILPPGVSQEEGTDVTEVLGVKKLDLASATGIGGRTLGVFPGFITKTDELRIQGAPSVLERHRGKTFYLTEKEDGTSFTAFLKDGELGLCGRNFLLDPTDAKNRLVELARNLELETRLRAACEATGTDLAIQGEVIGPGIQKNKYALKHTRLRIFNVFDIRGFRLLSHSRMLEIVHLMQLETVPQLGTLVLDHSVDDLVAMSQGTSTLNPNVQREGIVLRPLEDEVDPDLGRLSFKVINPRFLLKYDE